MTCSDVTFDLIDPKQVECQRAPGHAGAHMWVDPDGLSLWWWDTADVESLKEPAS